MGHFYQTTRPLCMLTTTCLKIDPSFVKEGPKVPNDIRKVKAFVLLLFWKSIILDKKSQYEVFNLCTNEGSSRALKASYIEYKEALMIHQYNVNFWKMVTARLVLPLAMFVSQNRRSNVLMQVKSSQKLWKLWNGKDSRHRKKHDGINNSGILYMIKSLQKIKSF